MGDLGQRELTAEQLEAIGNVDVLLVPVGGVYTIGAKDAAKIVSQIEPRIVVPMHYSLANLKIKLEKVDEFLRIMGAKSAEPETKLTLKAKDLSGEETKIVLLSIA